MKSTLRTIVTLTLTAAVAVAIGACGSSSGDDTANGTAAASGGGGKAMTLGLQQPWTSLPVYVALDQGFFKQHGIPDVTIVKFTALPALTTSLVRGQVDVALQTSALLPVYNKQSQGSPLRFFSPGQAAALTWVAKKGTNIPVATPDDWQSTVKAFRGKKVGVAALGGITDLMTRYMGSQVGLEAGKDFSISAIGVGPPEVAALKAGVVDMTTGDAFGATSVIQSGGGQPVLNMLTDQAPPLFRDILVAGYLAPEDRLDQQPGRYQAFDAGIQDALRFMKDPANEAAIEQTAVKRIGITEKLAKALYPTISSFQIQLTPAVIDKTTKALVASKVIPGPAPSYGDMVWKPKAN